MVRSRRYRMERKLVVQVRYYETMFLIRDEKGERIYAGVDEETSLGILRALNQGLARPRKAWPKKILKSKPRRRK